MGKNKVGILTFHRASNYGAVLQAYALQKYLAKNNIPNDIIDYKCDYIEKAYTESFLEKGKNPSIIIKNKIKKILNTKKNNKFDKFRNENLVMSNKVYTEKNREEFNQDYDKIIVGSDQVWNLKQTGEDETYFLDFYNKEKVSYAASIGKVSVTEEEQKVFNKTINKFKKISVREEESIDIVKTSGYSDEINVNLDPVFLLNKEEWMKLLEGKKENKIKEKYVLIYTVKHPEILIEKAKEYAKKHNCKVIYLHSEFTYKEFFNDNSMKHIFNKSPMDFLNLIINCECLFTTSFHGTAFAVILEKIFWVDIDRKGKINNRIFNLLGKVGLQDRILDDNPSSLESDIEWKTVRKNIDIEENRSRNYLLEK